MAKKKGNQKRDDRNKKKTSIGHGLVVCRIYDSTASSGHYSSIASTRFLYYGAL